jgi:hypothetical protein
MDLTSLDYLLYYYLTNPVISFVNIIQKGLAVPGVR